jgi:adenylate cyclase, class 2
MHFEVEQKFPLANSTATERRLRELGAREGESMIQVDQYFNHPARDFAATDEAFRIRQIGEANFITYKGPKLDATTKTRKELELPLPSGAATAESFAELLLALGFRRVAAVRKHRRTMYLHWQGGDAEIALDEVDRVGTFIEIELSATEDDLDAAKKCLASLAAELNLKNAERRSYLELLLSAKA